MKTVKSLSEISQSPIRSTSIFYLYFSHPGMGPEKPLSMVSIDLKCDMAFFQLSQNVQAQCFMLEISTS